jgi:mono/diheme cytochrome c family protein
MKIYKKNGIACHGSDGTGALAGVPGLAQVTGFTREGDANITGQDKREVLKFMHKKFSSE